VIAKIGDNVVAGGWKHLRVDLTLAASAGNAYQGGTNTDFVHLIAVQYNGPAPVPNKQGFSSGAYAIGWPVDYPDYAYMDPDDDPNYP
jgi:hypothetical protein